VSEAADDPPSAIAAMSNASVDAVDRTSFPCAPRSGIHQAVLIGTFTMGPVILLGLIRLVGGGNNLGAVGPS
jgi:hypothetical protein